MAAVTVVRMHPDDAHVAPVIAAHVRLMDATSPPDACHRLDPDELARDPAITFFAARDGDRVVGIGAHAGTGDGWGEVKSMHVVADRRGEGIGHRLLAAIEQVAHERGDAVVRLETGTHLAAAISLYERAGYRRRGPFGDYAAHPATLFMEKDLAGSTSPSS